MAENNQEITYIPYGQDEISQQDLMTNLANGVEGYLGSRRWARKDKYRNAWLAAYQDIINHGLTGASNDSGVWTINHGQEAIPLDTKSNLEKEMYQDAAYYIQQQMAKMTPRKKEEEKKKENLTPFKFKESFTQQLLNNRFGGDSSLFGDSEQGWNTLDARDEKTGLRGTAKRREAMVSELESYLKTIEDGKYNFEGTSFKDENDARTKIQTAINALKTDEEADDIPAFNALGLNYRGFFSNGGNDPYTKGDYTGTYSGYNEYLAEQNKAKQKAEQEKLKAQRANQWDGYKYYNYLNGTPSNAQDFQNIQQKLTTGQDLDGNDISRLSWVFRQAQKSNGLINLSKEELSRMPMYANNPSRFKKLNGIEGIYFDTYGNKFVRPYKNNQQQFGTTLQTILDQNSPEVIVKRKQEAQQKAQDNYLNSTEGGFTPAEQREVAALLFDLGAAVDPEGFSSAGLSQIASGIRDYNRASDPEGWTWGDTGWATLDHGLGLLSLIPVAGGWVKGAWAAKKLGNYLPKMEKWIRLVGRAGSTYAMTTNASGALNTLNKIKNGEDLSLKDYQDLAYFFIGGLGHHQLNRSNRTARSAMKARGVETSNSILNKAGITRTKPKVNTTETTPTLKIKKTGENGKVETQEIPIKKEQQEVLRNTKPSEVDSKAKELLGDKIPEGYKVETNTGWRARVQNYAKGFIGRSNSEIFGTPQTSQKDLKIKSDEEFEQYLSEYNNNWFKKFVNGSNRDIRRYDRYLGNSNESGLISSASGEESPYARKPLEQGEIKKSNHIEGFPDKSQAKESSFNRAIMNRYRRVMEGKFSNKEMQGGKESIKIGNEEVRVYTSKDAKGNNSVFNVTVSGKSHNFKTQEEAKKFIANIVKQQKNNITSGKITKENIKEIGKVLQNLKRKGWLKQGGQINPSLDTIIEDFIKNNNI